MSTDEIKSAVAQVPDAKSAVSTLGWAMLVQFLLALAQIVNEFLPQIQQVILAAAPGWAAPLIIAGLSALGLWLTNRGQAKTKVAVTKALNTPAPSDTRYTQ